mgnify:FL=1
MGGMVTILLGIILVLEIITALNSILAIYSILAFGELDNAIVAIFLACITILLLLFGQRVAKDYAGALTITCYFIVAIFGLYVVAR